MFLFFFTTLSIILAWVMLIYLFLVILSAKLGEAFYWKTVHKISKVKIVILQKNVPHQCLVDSVSG